MVEIMREKEGDIDDLPKNSANYTALTPLGFLERAALVHPHRNAVIHGDVHFTWLQTYRRCRRLASALNQLGVGSGSTVFISFLLSTLSLFDYTISLTFSNSFDIIYVYLILPDDQILLSIFIILEYSDTGRKKK